MYFYEEKSFSFVVCSQPPPLYSVPPVPRGIITLPQTYILQTFISASGMEKCFNISFSTLSLILVYTKQQYKHSLGAKMCVVLSKITPATVFMIMITGRIFKSLSVAYVLEHEGLYTHCSASVKLFTLG